MKKIRREKDERKRKKEEGRKERKEGREGKGAEGRGAAAQPARKDRAGALPRALPLVQLHPCVPPALRTLCGPV